VLYSPQHNEVYEINAFFAELFSCFISRGHLTPMSKKGSKCRQGNSFGNQRAFTMLETEVFKYKF